MILTKKKLFSPGVQSLDNDDSEEDGEDERISVKRRLLKKNHSFTQTTSSSKTMHEDLANTTSWMYDFDYPQTDSNPENQVLLDFYHKNVVIKRESFDHACYIVDTVLILLEKHARILREPKDPEICNFLKSGSACEGLKVGQPDEFDVIVPIVVTEEINEFHYNFITDYDRGVPPGFAICQVIKVSEATSPDKLLKRSERFGECLFPEKLVFSWLLSLLSRSVRKLKQDLPEHLKLLGLKIKRNRPAIMLHIGTEEVESYCVKDIAVDIVLALKLNPQKLDKDSRYAVAKVMSTEAYCHWKITSAKHHPQPLPLEDTNLLWRISTSFHEKRFLDYVESVQDSKGCHKICLGILKRLRDNDREVVPSSPFSFKTSSYFLKTTLFHVLLESNLKEDWVIEKLSARYLDLLRKYKFFLDNLKMPHFFFNNQRLSVVFPEEDFFDKSQDVNLFNELAPNTVYQIKARLEQILNHTITSVCLRSVILGVSSTQEELDIHAPYIRRVSSSDESFYDSDDSGSSLEEDHKNRLVARKMAKSIRAMKHESINLQEIHSKSVREVNSVRHTKHHRRYDDEDDVYHESSD